MQRQDGKPAIRRPKNTELKMPEGYKFGQCFKCRRSFHYDPRFPKRFLCNHCWEFKYIEPTHEIYKKRKKIPRTPDLLASIGFLEKMYGPAFTWYLSEVTGYKRQTIVKWNKQGRIPGTHGAPEIVAGLLGFTMDEFKAYVSSGRKMKCEDRDPLA